MKQQREPMIMVCVGMMGVGKTFRTRQEVAHAVKAGRKVLIFDATLDMAYQKYKTMLVTDIAAFNKQTRGEVRRIVAVDKYGEELNTEQKREMLETILKNFKGGLFVLEDLNNYIPQVNNFPELIKHIISHRHKNLDIIMHLQSLRRLDTILWQNVRCVRVHYDLEDVSTFKDRLANKYEIFKIATLIVATEYKKYDQKLQNDSAKRFFCYVMMDTLKIVGVMEKQFADACKLYVLEEPSLLKKIQKINKVSEIEAFKIFVEEKKKEYLG